MACLKNILHGFYKFVKFQKILAYIEKNIKNFIFLFDPFFIKTFEFLCFFNFDSFKFRFQFWFSFQVKPVVFSSVYNRTEGFDSIRSGQI